MSSLMSSLILSYHTIPRYNKLTLSATMLFDWSIVFSPPSLVTPPVSYSRSHAAIFSQTHILMRNISRRFFCRRFFAVCVALLCCWVPLQPQSSTGFDVISFIVRFVLQFCVVVEFHSSHSLSSSSFSQPPPPTPTPGHTFNFSQESWTRKLRPRPSPPPRQRSSTRSRKLSLLLWPRTRVQWFWLFFTLWGITTHPWHPKGPRIWKLAKKKFQLHPWPAEIFAKTGKCDFWV